MLKVKVFKEMTRRELEDAINEFIKDKQIFDIHYAYGIDRYFDDHYSAMVIYYDYEEVKENV